jgi:hypothetical protein
MSLLHRAQGAIQRRTRRVVPAEEATLTTMLEAPRATVGLSFEQQQTLSDLQRSAVSAH